eukprot:TRINITY_DN14367_c0_g1_i2.p1 TRINITY_DN14367_c0_g1~~TRINITY_DN14367_c0_g1_i2.p1  ORF type:complete len:369 (+),score=75.48 TRINITY_DN14367_c0_g1_i2:49-1155(+)
MAMFSHSTATATKQATQPHTIHMAWKPGEEQKQAIAHALLLDKKQRVLALVDPRKLKAQQEHFDVPEWAGKPKAGVNLVASRNGVVIHTHMLDKSPYYLLGRSQACDITLDHMSISRVHCAVIHHESQSVYVMDLGSGYGTKVSGQKLEPNKPRKLSETDELVVGESTRVYRLSFTAPETSKKRKHDDVPAAPVPERRLEEEREQAARDAEREILARADSKRQKQGPADFWGGKKAPRKVDTPPPDQPADTSPVKVSHIVLLHNSADQSVGRTLEEAMAAGANLRHSILLNLDGKGTAHSFAKGAKKSSECPSAQKKGLLGVVGTPSFPLDLCPNDVAQEAKLMLQDSVSQPLVSAFGVHLLYRHAEA